MLDCGDREGLVLDCGDREEGLVLDRGDREGLVLDRGDREGKKRTGVSLRRSRRRRTGVLEKD